ncbi:hypothetical protein BX600DRAFT_476560 [Xylariales sp. PMI_506]|nr:hypothetical protein BX600DRAFT_476560 [Xylariales sp. PMI_506]
MVAVDFHAGSKKSPQNAVHAVRNYSSILPRTAFIGVLLALYIITAGIPYQWLLSSAPLLTALMCIRGPGERAVPVVAPLSLNLIYSVCATSWLLYWVFTALCYLATFIFSIYQLQIVAQTARRVLRRLLRDLHFTADKIALFEVPALEIDTDVEGLMVIRGLTISLSSLTIIAHGIEVGIKLSDDLELAIQTDQVTVRLFRSIEVEDVFANLKGGEYEMTFGHLAGRTHDKTTGEALMNTDTPLLRAAAAASSVRLNDKTTMANRMTNKVDGSAPRDGSAKAGYDSMTQVFLDDDEAREHYRDTLDWIDQTSIIKQSTNKVTKRVRSISSVMNEGFDYRKKGDMRAVVCSLLHETPSVPHPPKRSVKVTTLKNLSPPYVRRFLHRMPLLLRLLLSALSHLHTIHIAAITATGSGKWIRYMLQKHVFQHYGEKDSEIHKLEERVSSWLSDANFVVELNDITAQAQVPVNTHFDIRNHILLREIISYRALPEEADLKQVFRLGGADAEISLPSFLLPHHEHLLPPIPTEVDERAHKQDAKQANGSPQAAHAETTNQTQALKDEANMKLAARLRLPAVFDQELLDWVAALIKATKVIEWEKDPNHSLQDAHGVRELAKVLQTTVKDGVKRVAVDAVTNDRWIAKLVGKITKNLQSAKGDVGYSGEFPVALKPYRDAAEDASKLLP